ncbi:MAG: NUDIX domain-containing protein [Candidatus Moranbacteria bacterium]|nr:NUDIX domain-containing protein [Candidatus Moranbacteria bacterium]
MKKEPILIVDENDNVIGIKDRSLVRVGSPYIYRVSALWVANSRGDVLLAQRAFTKRNDPGKWGPAVSGTVEAGETYNENIMKEAEEELDIVGIRFKSEVKMRRGGEYGFFVQWYSAIIDKPEGRFNIQEDEVERVKWFSRDELRTECKEHPERFVSGMETYLKYFVDGIIG